MRRILLELAKVFPAALVAVVCYFLLTERQTYSNAYRGHLCFQAQVSAARGELDRTEAKDDRTSYLRALQLLADRSDSNGYPGLPITITALRVYADGRHGRSITRAVGELEDLNRSIPLLRGAGPHLDEEELGKQVEAIVDQAEEIDGSFVAHFGVLPEPSIQPPDEAQAVPWFAIVLVAVVGSIAGLLVTAALARVRRMFATTLSAKPWARSQT